MFFMISVFFVWTVAYLKSFKKKLAGLLYLEGLMLSMIFFSHHFLSTSGSTSSFSATIMVIFMVLESILGISLLIGATRNSAPASNIYTNF